MIASASDIYLDDTRPLAPGDAVAALLLAPDGRYLLQLRDAIPGIFFPEHWGLFGGGVDAADADATEALRRELREEISLDVPRTRLEHLTAMTFDFTFCGRGVLYRNFYVVRIDAAEIGRLSLGEGREMRLFTPREALSTLRMVPYDAFALWMHANQARLHPGH
jgi:8-oxo-dGTP pyrophosphatase MutT (NUDIX family)